MLIPYVSDPSRKRVAAFGSALVDLCLLEREEFLTATGAQKGGMILSDYTSIKGLLDKASSTPIIVPGGSACNTIVGIGKLGGSVRFMGKRGNDELGVLFEKGLIKNNVEPILFTCETPTGHVLSIITPDAQRSMFTFLGASAETSPAEILHEHFKDSAVAHFEGYLVSNPEVMLAALDAAKTAGAMISLDLASYTVVNSSKELFEKIISEYVDILIANEDEACAFAGCRQEEQALEYLSTKANLAVMKLGKRGSIVAHEGVNMQIPPHGSGFAIDTTGAGDLWAAGFLYGLVNGFTLEKCGALGSACGFEVCQNIGASISDEGWQRIKTQFQL
ncbi:adenosine kinase [Chitinispirillales bacterium ANBcel5]|uniref:adenosine kinase n=1 Tax=Cellulosispirillum alkaliphilum TaxID=3039283 RepID=UPI002A4F776C|nr:adenosine kinase [Chitinispirillales bacterium ANBcel5]